ncbi:aminotransferase class I/II-fold pyridoxal phosphate-dependent enzyme [Eshraghiella crossota]|jgi:histidinol-phosphate/aromatic aminotransferase/cobyric acid decarboxylase-like protein/choline kinase|uniref:Aminotransferase n=2 Tax=Eshraghiella TaxID=3342669 RepID=R5LHG2_9FIRM|nr:hemolysin erythrocyte lysis protein [Butyrivibrio crossotus CAG:259]HAX08354.1 aminotransferase [Butyrivibrio sp.]
MQSIILAAGLGSRLGELTKECTKCMVKINGITLIERMLRQLDRYGMDRIIIVTGYKGDILKDYVQNLRINTPVVFVDNSDYRHTNNIYSLWLTREFLEEMDSLVLESDMIFEDRVIEKMLAIDNGCGTFVARPRPWMDGSIVKLDKDNNIVYFVDDEEVKRIDPSYYHKIVSIYKFKKRYVSEKYMTYLNEYVKKNKDNNLYESLLKVIDLDVEKKIPAEILDEEQWYEINDIQDMDIAESMFADGNEKVRKYLQRYGGYWRYPAMRDFCYLVNPYFPNERFMNEMKSNFDVLVREYPSGMAVNSLLAGHFFGVRTENICVGNGTAELIKSLMENISGNIGMVYPTFEEYPHRKKDVEVIPYYVVDKDFDYSVDDIMSYYEGKDISAIVLVNPDNPSGHFISKKDILRLEDWCRSKGRKLIVDESFIDFVEDDEWHTLLDMEVLLNHPSLIVLKSISKSFGVAGLRLGVIATADTDLIAFMKKDVAIWNINSFAEYYLQIIEKYRDDYYEAMEKFKEVRRRYLDKLSKIKGFKVYPSQANYVMCHIENSVTSTELADILLNRYNVLIKNLASKEGLNKGNYVRLSVKSDEENDYIVNALMEIFNN